MSQNPDSSFSLIDHTADLGFEVLADSLPKLMEEAAKALFSIIADLDNVKEDKHLRIEMPTDSPEENLRYWLEELLFRFNSADTLFSKFTVSEEDNHFVGTAGGELFDPKRHTIHTEIKGITYHQFEVSETDDGWRATIILDV